jgi:hypothetical protein
MSLSDTISINDGYYVMPSQDAYSTLIQQSVNKKTNNYFILNTPYCIQQVYIPNPYRVNYWLELSGFTFPNFKYDPITGISSFDVNDYKDIIPHVGDEVYIDNKNKFPRIQIMYPQNNTVVYNKPIIPIRIVGFEQLDAGGIEPIDVTLQKYLTTYSLQINSPTDSIDFLGKPNTVYPSSTATVTATANITLSLNNKVYQSIYVGPSVDKQTYRIKLDNTSGTFAEGPENIYLSSEINTNTINLSKVDNIDIVFDNFDCANINQNVYLAYSYPERKRIFK